MRLGILILLLVATIFGGGLWFNHVNPICRVPLTYRIGEIDPRFEVESDEARRIVRRAEAVWEVPLNADLFVYDPEAAFSVNFVFDERQENAALEAELRKDLEAKEGMSESVAAEYDRLISQFRTLKDQYESGVQAYEQALNAYNEEVAEWNTKGGAPREVVDELRSEEAELKKEFGRLEALSEKLNGVVADLNEMGAEGNSLIADYNTVVEEYNERFGEHDEFTQGDYMQNTINIYQFDSEDELIIVLAHEFGHALSLDHVENAESIMFHFMGEQDSENGVTAEDIAEYRRICEERRGIVDTVRLIWRAY